MLLTGMARHKDTSSNYRGPIKLKTKEPKSYFQLTQYFITFTPNFDSLVLKPNQTINGGAIKIDRIVNLLLTDPVRAAAQFNWHVDYNSAAQAITGTRQRSGVGIVNFGKQPNGRWVVTGYKLEASVWDW